MNKKALKTASEELSKYIEILYSDTTSISYEVVAGITIEELIQLLEYSKNQIDELLKNGG